MNILNLVKSENLGPPKLLLFSLFRKRMEDYNHAIDLKETFIPKVAKTYPMNLKEMDTCKEFIDKHLKSGKIRKSRSPQASPFFFVQKKDGGL